MIQTVVLTLLVCSRASANWPPAEPLIEFDDKQEFTAPPSVHVAPVGPGQWECEFFLRPDFPGKATQPSERQNAQPVDQRALVGPFNGWSSQANPFKRQLPDGTYVERVRLGRGIHPYKFFINGEWLADPENRDTLPDDHGGRNSVVRLGRLAGSVRSEAKPGDGIIGEYALEHDPKLPLFFQPLAPNRVLIRYRTLANDVSKVAVAIKGGQTFAMRLVDRDDRFDLYEAEVTVANLKPDEAFDYAFILDDGAGPASDPQLYAAYIRDPVQTPEWAKHAIWYQILVDRFRNGNTQVDPLPLRSWTSEWFTPSDWEKKTGQPFYKWYVFDRMYGGDLEGVEQMLPYLKELGVNALYFNPIFQAQGHHKYNATNFLHIDDFYGGGTDYAAISATEDLNDPKTWKWTQADQRFLEFIQAAKAAGFRVIIDGVFNHIGPEHPAFVDVKKNGKNSKYADWFDVVSWEPFKYNGWAGFDGLPAFKKDAKGLASEAATQHIFNVTRRWLDPNGDGDPSDGVDGWRLDVPAEIPQPFWEEWRAVVKSINPEAYTTGEIWDRADTWVSGKHFDAVMNYQFSKPVVAWVFDKQKKITASELDRRLRAVRLAYPQAASYVMQNLMCSHDTDRIASMAFNPDRPYDDGNRVQDNGPKYNNAKPDAAAYQRARLALLIQMTYVGAPMIYYGDEVGMWGGDDPNCRKPMLWEDLQPYDDAEQNFVLKDNLAFYRAAIQLRAAHPALRIGDFETLLTDDAADVWVFRRWTGSEELIVALNASDKDAEVKIPLPPGASGKWGVVFESKAAMGSEAMNAAAVETSDGAIRLRVPAAGGAVLAGR